jgi:large subunit ribosomal protein L6
VPEVLKSISIPENVDIQVEQRVVIVNGEKGTLKRDFFHAPISFRKTGSTIEIWANWPNKKEAALVGTLHSHIRNMIKGVTQGFTHKLKIVFSHFPITVRVIDDEVFIENFTGERNQRKAKIRGDVTVSVKGEDVIIQGINIEDVSQTAANIQQATKIRKKDPRVFLDGIYLYEKSEGMEA